MRRDPHGSGSPLGDKRHCSFGTLAAEPSGSWLAQQRSPVGDQPAPASPSATVRPRLAISSRSSGRLIVMTSTNGASPSAPTCTSLTIQTTRPPPGQTTDAKNTALALTPPNLAAVPGPERRSPCRQSPQSDARPGGAGCGHSRRHPSPITTGLAGCAAAFAVFSGVCGCTTRTRRPASSCFAPSPRVYCAPLIGSNSDSLECSRDLAKRRQCRISRRDIGQFSGATVVASRSKAAKLFASPVPWQGQVSKRRTPDWHVAEPASGMSPVMSLAGQARRHKPRMCGNACRRPLPGPGRSPPGSRP